MKSFDRLTEQEILALAITLEEEDARIYEAFAEGLRDRYPAQADKFCQMRQEEVEHARRLRELYHSRFGEHIPLIRREDVQGFIKRKSIWLAKPLSLKAARKEAASMEIETGRYYEASAKRATDPGIRRLLMDLAADEQGHVHVAEELGQTTLSVEERALEKRRFALQVVQPGLAGLMDGSVSTLAPLFAAAFATGKSHSALLVGLAASLGAGISMGFAEALSDDGTLTGRGLPWARGGVCGTMTAAGGLGHTLPYLISDVHTATTVALSVVVIELGVISWIRHRYMETPWTSAILQVGLGGALVFLVGMLIGIS
jgi:rubrerythrin